MDDYGEEPVPDNIKQHSHTGRGRKIVAASIGTVGGLALLVWIVIQFWPDQHHHTPSPHFPVLPSHLPTVSLPSISLPHPTTAPTHSSYAPGPTGGIPSPTS
jgi:hypothetical protein